MCQDYYENSLAVDKVIAKILRLTFLAHPVFLEIRIIHLHFPADSLCLSSFNLYRAMLAQSAVMRLLSSVRLSVRLSVRP